jgi:hypothetical protein
MLILEQVMSGRQVCPSCRGDFEAVKFSPPERRVRVVQVAEAGPTGAAPCSSHPANASVTSCGRCGVFMCGLCRIDVDGQTLCPGCFERLSSEGALASVQVRFKDYTRMGQSLAVLGLLIWPFAVAIGPAAVYYGVRSILQKRARGESEGTGSAVVAIVVGLLQAVLGVFLLFMMFR